MPKKLAAEDQVADPVRSRLQAPSTSSRLGALASQAAGQAPPVQPQEQTPTKAASVRVEEHQKPSLSAAPVVPGKAPTGRSPAPAVAEHEQERASEVRKSRFTPTEAQANSDIVALVTRLTASKPSESGVTRVLWSLLREAEADLKQQGRKGVVLRRPPNGSSIEMASYERDLGRFILSALKSLEL